MYTGEGNGTPLQYSCLENPMDGGAWQAADHGVTKSRTRLSDFTFTFPFHALEKEMATHSSVVTWRIPGTGGAWWATVYGVTQSRTRLKRLSSSSSMYAYRLTSDPETVHNIDSVQLLSCVRLFATPCTAAHQASLSITNSLNLLKLTSIELVTPSNHLILCHPLLLHLNLSQHWVFSIESALHIRWPKYWSFSFNISPSNEHPGLISFRMDRLDLLAVHGTRKSLFQHHSSKASILRCSALFLVQLSHPYMTSS